MSNNKTLGNLTRHMIHGTLLTCSATVFAAGFGVNEQSTSALGTGFAGRASDAQDASIQAENPAGISDLKSTQATAGADVILTAGNFKGTYTRTTPSPLSETSEDKNFLRTTPIPFGYFSTPINDQLTFGLGVYAPFGLNLKYSNNFVGRFFNLQTKLQSINYQATLAYKIRPNLSFGVGLIYSDFTGTIAKNVVTPSGEGYSRLKGSDSAMGWTAGLLWHATPYTQVGLAYHSPLKFNLSGNVSVEKLNIDTPAFLKVDLPEIAILSVTHQLNQKWKVMSDVTWTRWNRLQTLNVNTPLVPAVSDTLDLYWHNSWSASLGASYQLNDKWLLRGGYMYEQTPVNETYRSLKAPDNNRNWLTFGARYMINSQLSADFAVAYVLMQSSSVNLSDSSSITPGDQLTGRYSNLSSFVLGAQLNYKF